MSALLQSLNPRSRSSGVSAAAEPESKEPGERCQRCCRVGIQGAGRAVSALLQSLNLRSRASGVSIAAESECKVSDSAMSALLQSLNPSSLTRR